MNRAKIAFPDTPGDTAAFVAFCLGTAQGCLSPSICVAATEPQPYAVRCSWGESHTEVDALFRSPDACLSSISRRGYAQADPEHRCLHRKKLTLKSTDHHEFSACELAGGVSKAVSLRVWRGLGVTACGLVDWDHSGDTASVPGTQPSPLFFVSGQLRAA